jgi:pyruvate,water dikinase
MAASENSQGERRGLGSVLRDWLSRIAGKRARSSPAVRPAQFRLTYSRFREILTVNDGILRTISEVEEKATGQTPFALPPILRKVRQAELNAAVIAKNLNQIAGGQQYCGLYDALRRIQEGIASIVDRHTGLPDGPLILPLQEVRRGCAAAAGSKAAALGELRAALRLAVPDGFVITTTAFSLMLRAAGQYEEASTLDCVLEQSGREALEGACQRVRDGILNTMPPPEVLEAISRACRVHFGASQPSLAVRSSAVGEDTASSHAGQYLTKLGVPCDELAFAWREVVASAFSPDVVAYRYLRGLAFEHAGMAVLVLRMLQPRAAGVLFTRDVNDPTQDAVVVSMIPGRGDALVSGRTDAFEVTLRSDCEHPWTAESVSADLDLIHPSELAQLHEAARRLEALFGDPQDVEWAIEDGQVYFLQSRPLVVAPSEDGEEPAIVFSGDSAPAPIIEGGRLACPGIGIGPVRRVLPPDLPDSLPAGTVLVAPNAVVELSRFMPSCAAVVTEVGSPTSHMAILSREFGVPTLVGATGALGCVSDGQAVTVDATHRRVFAGAFPVKGGRRDASGKVSRAAPLASSPVVRLLREVGEWVTPLHLTDATAPEFAPEYCRSLHDLTRFVHECVYRAMFRFGEEVQESLPTPLVLDAPMPLAVHLFDLGGGVKDGFGTKVPPSAINSEPMLAFIRGLTDPRIKWDRPRSVSATGFLSIVGESMIAAPPDTERIAQTCFCVVSGNYMNFAVRAGYHFSTVDAWCGAVENRNYVHFHLAGGVAGLDRRERRRRFLTRVLLQMQFEVRSRGDMTTARLEKFDRATTLAALEALGRLSFCVRQIDMLMDTDSDAEEFARAFLAEDFARF